MAAPPRRMGADGAAPGLTALSATAWLCGRGDAVRKHLNKIVVVVVAIIFTTWFLLWPDEEEPLAPPPAAESSGP